jgi:hypothetical protein
MSKPNTFTIAVLTSMLFTSIAIAQSYPIKLTRDEKIGDQYTTRISGSVKHTVQLTVSGQVRPKSSDHLVFDLRGLVKILAVNPRTATATRITCRITRFTRNGDEVCPAGAVVAAGLKDGKTTYTIDGKAADEKDMDLLNMVLELEDPETTGNSDDIAGTDKPRATGDAWPINTDNFSKAMNAGGLPIGTGAVKGESKLLSVKKENGQAVMEVETVATAEGFKKELKKGSTLSDGSMKVQVNVVVPVDPKLPMISSTTRSHLSTTITEGTLKRVVVEDRELEELHEAVKP